MQGNDDVQQKLAELLLTLMVCLANRVTLCCKAQLSKGTQTVLSLWCNCRATKEAEKAAAAAAKEERIKAMQERLATWQASQDNS